MFFIIEKLEETTFEFSQNAATVLWSLLHIIMETQKIAKLLGNADSESSKFATRKWYFTNDQSNTDYGEGNENDTTIKFQTKVIKSNLCDYSDAYILLTGDITDTRVDDDTRDAFKNCTPFTKCISQISDEQVDNADNLDIVMTMYNLIEYSDNYSYTSRSLRQFKRDESPVTNTWNPNNVSIYNLPSFKYKSSFIRKSANIGGNGVYRDVKIAVPIKYLGNFWRLLEMPLRNCKVHLELNWSINCVMSDVAGVTEFKTIKTKLYVPIVTLSKTDNVKLVKLLEHGFQRPVYWNE